MTLGRLAEAPHRRREPDGPRRGDDMAARLEDSVAALILASRRLKQRGRNGRAG